MLPRGCAQHYAAEPPRETTFYFCTLVRLFEEWEPLRTPEVSTDGETPQDKRVQICFLILISWVPGVDDTEMHDGAKAKHVTTRMFPGLSDLSDLKIFHLL